MPPDGDEFFLHRHSSTPNSRHNDSVHVQTNRKPWRVGPNICTLSDVTSYSRRSFGDGATISDHDYNNGSTVRSVCGGDNALMAIIQHIPNLPQANEALSILRRVHSEFLPIARRHGWSIKTVTEMCCCGDGLDYSMGKGLSRFAICGKNGETNFYGTRRKRKTTTTRRTMPNNVLGYNRTSYSHSSSSSRPTKYHEIHLRLRKPSPSHALFSYEEIAATMSHEMAHCVYGKHDAKFYKLMEEIQTQHAILLATGEIAKDGDHFPLNCSTFFALGGVEASRVGKRKRSLQAAEARRKKQYQQPRTLCDDSKTMLANLPPREAALIAAERRRDRSKKGMGRHGMEQKQEMSNHDGNMDTLPWCLPCEEIIEILDEDDGTDNDYRTDEEIDAVDVNDEKVMGSGANEKGFMKKRKQDSNRREEKEDCTTGNIIMIDLDDETPIVKGRSGSIASVSERNFNGAEDDAGFEGNIEVDTCSSLLQGEESPVSLISSREMNKERKDFVEVSFSSSPSSCSSSASSLSVVDLRNQNQTIASSRDSIDDNFLGDDSLFKVEPIDLTSDDKCVSSLSSSSYSQCARSQRSQHDGESTEIPGIARNGATTVVDAVSSSREDDEWSCEVCTFLNAPVVLVCVACNTTRELHNELDCSLAKSTKKSSWQDLNVDGRYKQHSRRDSVRPYQHSQQRKDDGIADFGCAATPKGKKETYKCENGWTCGTCTFLNTHLSTVECEACGSELSSGGCKAPKIVSSKARNSEISEKDIILNEVRRSKTQFGGFDIYGSVCTKSLTMRHMT